MEAVPSYLHCCVLPGRRFGLDFKGAYECLGAAALEPSMKFFVPGNTLIRAQNGVQRDMENDEEKGGWNSLIGE